MFDPAKEVFIAEEWHYGGVTDRGRLLAGGLGQGDVEFEDFAVTVSVDR